MDKRNQNKKHEEETKLSTECSARPRGSQTIIWVPGSKKHAKVDVHVERNVSIPFSKVATLIMGCSTAVCILNVFFLTAAMRYDSPEVRMMKQNIMVLNHKVELMAMTSDSLHQSIVILQDKMNRLMSTHCNVAGGVSANYQGTEHSQKVNVAPGPELTILLGNNFSLLEIDGDMLDVGGGLKGTVELENVVDVKNRTLSSSAEVSDFLFFSANDTSVDTFGSIFTNYAETSGRLQELRLEDVTDSSQPYVMDIMLQADDSSSHEHGETDGTSMGRAKRSNRRGNEKPSGGRRHLNNKRKNGGTINFFCISGCLEMRLALHGLTSL